MSEIKVVPCANEMCLFRAEENSKYCKHHRHINEPYDAKIAATRPVETRPPALCPTCYSDKRSVRHAVFLDKLCIDAWHKTAKNPEPVEQAAPPRPKCQVCGTELTNFPWTGWGCDKCNCPRCHCHGLSRSYGKECNQPAPAAIEQARPQPPECPQCKGKKILSCGEIGTVYCTLCAAAEPAPERTPPQDIDFATVWEMPQGYWHVITNSPKGEVIYATLSKELADLKAASVNHDLAEFNARAVAVPEPAAQPTTDLRDGQWIPPTVTVNLKQAKEIFAEPAAQQELEVEYMVRRFLMWRLPENFNPDAGISFKPTFNENTAWGPDKHNPIGTNLFDYTQAKEMVQFMLEGMPARQAEPAPTPSREASALVKE